MTKQLITTREELDALGVGTNIWGTSPYRRLSEEDGYWWDFANGYAVGSDDIILPAILVWDGTAPRHVGVCPEMGCDGLTVAQWSGVACDTCPYAFCY